MKLILVEIIQEFVTSVKDVVIEIINIDKFHSFC